MNWRQNRIGRRSPPLKQNREDVGTESDFVALSHGITRLPFSAKGETKSTVALPSEQLHRIGTVGGEAAIAVAASRNLLPEDLQL